MFSALLYSLHSLDLCANSKATQRLARTQSKTFPGMAEANLNAPHPTRLWLAESTCVCADRPGGHGGQGGLHILLMQVYAESISLISRVSPNAAKVPVPVI